MKHVLLASLALSAAVPVAGCTPDLDDRTSRIEAPRVLAVRAEPPEAKPGEAVRLTALVVDAQGGISAAPSLAWAACIARKPLAELGPVAPACLAAAGSELVPLGGGAEVNLTVPRDTCRLFGPERPIAKPGEPAGRPVDPNPTGGFYQPGRVDLAGATPGSGRTLFEVRIGCTLGGLTQAELIELEKRSLPNANPLLDDVKVVRGGEESVDSARIKPGEKVTLRASWKACGDAVPCTGAERYAYFDATTRTVQDRREAIRLSWFSATGAFDEDRTGRGEQEASSTTSDNVWTAPSAPMDARVWIVLRDSRGGAAFRSVVLHVNP